MALLMHSKSTAAGYFLLGRPLSHKNLCFCAFEDKNILLDKNISPANSGLAQKQLILYKYF